MPTIAVLTDAACSPLLHTLLRATSAIRARLGTASIWRGIRVREPDSSHEYCRVACDEQLVVGGRTLLVAVHLFEMAGYAGTMHDHRWPLAVLPFGITDSNAPLYEMPWQRCDGERTIAGGTLLVREQTGWAIEDCRAVRHAVRSLRPHLSLNLTDVTDPPTRGNRMSIESMPAAETERVLGVAREVTARRRE